MAREPDRLDMDREERVVVTGDDTATTRAPRERTTAVVDREPVVRRDMDEEMDYREHRGPRDWRVDMPGAFGLYEDRVHWGAVWAGLVTAFTTMIILGLLGVAVGLTAAAGGTPGVGAGGLGGFGAATGAAWWAAISGIVAFFLGGWVAGRLAAIYSRRWGTWNGALVFMLALPITMFLAGLGSAGILGAFGQVGTGFGIGTGLGTGLGTTGTLTSSAWWSLIGLVVALGAAALGGAAGTRTHIDLDEFEAELEPRGRHRDDDRERTYRREEAYRR